MAVQVRSRDSVASLSTVQRKMKRSPSSKLSEMSVLVSLHLLFFLAKWYNRFAHFPSLFVGHPWSVTSHLQSSPGRECTSRRLWCVHTDTAHNFSLSLSLSLSLSTESGTLHVSRSRLVPRECCGRGSTHTRRVCFWRTSLSWQYLSAE